MKVADPIVVLKAPATERWINIADARGRIITTIELLSPANGQGRDRIACRGKQQDLLFGGAHLVEIFCAVATTSLWWGPISSPSSEARSTTSA